MKINQILKEYEVPDTVDATDTDTYTPPSRGFAIKVHGPFGSVNQGQRQGVPAATLWYGLTAVFPNDYPPASFQSIGQQMASPQARVLNAIRREGSAVVKSGIASRDLAETLANKLASYGPHPSEPGAGRIPMAHIQVVSQDLEEDITHRLPQPEEFESDNDYYDALDAYGKTQDTDSDYENWAFDDTNESREKVGNMDADAFDAALARMKKLAGAGPLKTVYDPAKRVYKNVPQAVQPAQQPRKAK